MEHLLSSSCNAIEETITQHISVIDRLPEDLFIVIILELLSQPITFRNQKKNPRSWLLYRLMEVSRSWKDVIEKTPTFWTGIDSRDPIPIWNAALVRSRSALIDVKSSSGFEKSGEEWVGGDRFLLDVLPHIPRWRTAEIIRGGSHDISALELHTAPHLTKFDVRSFAEETFDLFRGHAPKLSSLSLRNVTPKSWSSPILRGLRELSLYLTKPGPLFQEMLDVLRGCPELEFLELRYISTPWDDLSIDTPPIVLFRLARMELTRMSSPGALLSAIHIPNCTRFKLDELWLTDRHFAKIDSAFRRHIRTAKLLQLNLDSTQSVFMSATKSAFGLKTQQDASIPGARFSLVVKDECSLFSLLFNWVLPILAPLNPAIDMHIGDLGDLSHWDMAELFRSLPGIRSITSTIMGEELKRILDMLGSPQTEDPDGAGIAEWLCPNLRSLALLKDSYYQNEPKLLLFVEARIEAFQKQEANGGAEGGDIVRLEKAIAEGSDTEFYNLIQDTLTGRTLLERRAFCQWMEDSKGQPDPASTA